MATVRAARLRGPWAALPALALSLGLAAPRTASSADPPKTSGAPAASASAAPSTSLSGLSPASASATAAATLPPTDDPKEKRERQAKAVELHNEAKALYERGIYRRAIAKLEAALALDPQGKELVYNLALIHEKLAEAERAESYYLRYIEMETDSKARERAEAIVKRIHAAKKNIKDDLQERAAPTASPSASASASAITPATGVAAAPSASAAASTTARMPSPMVFVIGGIALAAVGVGVGFGVSALTVSPNGVTTGPGVSAYDLEARASSAHTQAMVADLAFVTGITAGAGAVILYLLESRMPQAAPAPLPPRAARMRVEVPF
jgi:tetratricopeptide (TPR) repeat protein